MPSGAKPIVLPCTRAFGPSRRMAVEQSPNVFPCPEVRSPPARPSGPASLRQTPAKCSNPMPETRERAPARTRPSTVGAVPDVTPAMRTPAPDPSTVRSERAAMGRAAAPTVIVAGEASGNAVGLKLIVTALAVESRLAVSIALRRVQREASGQAGEATVSAGAVTRIESGEAATVLEARPEKRPAPRRTRTTTTAATAVRMGRKLRCQRRLRQPY